MISEEVTIESLAYGGDGVAHLADGRAVFVPMSCPGDKVLIDVKESKDRFAKGTIDQIVEASEHRVQPRCDEACTGRCGGCPWAQVAYEQQLYFKRRAVVDALTRTGKIEGAEELVGECIPSAKQWNYRNKVEFVVGQDVAGRFSLGMHAANSSAFDPLASCLLATKQYEKFPKQMTGALRFLQGADNLGIERVGVRVSTRTSDVELAIWTRTGRFPRAQAAKILTDAVRTKRPAITRVLLKDDTKTKARKVTGTENLAGKGHWTEEIDGRIMILSAPSFFQVNTPGAETLIKLVMEGLQPDSEDVALDLYSGAGTFTLPLAAAAGDVVAVESAGSSVRDLRRNLERNNLYADVIGGDVGRELPELGYADVAVVDPPRCGLAPEALSALLDTEARRIAYVSCDPQTLARDLKAVLADSRYVIKSVQPVDLFPQTYHVETVTILEKR